MSSSGVRRQLGPVDVNLLLEVENVDELLRIRPCLLVNKEYHSKLTHELVKLLDEEEDKDVVAIIEDELDKCTELEMDVDEVFANLDCVLSTLSSNSPICPENINPIVEFTR